MVFTSLGALLIIFLKPSTIYLLPILLVMYLFKLIVEKHQPKKLAIFGIITTTVCLLLVVGYCLIFQKHYKVFGLTYSHNHQQFVVALQRGYYKDSDDKELVEFLDKEIASHQEINTRKLWLLMMKVKDIRSLEEMENFNKEVFEKNKDSYFNDTTKLIKETWNQKFFGYYAIAGEDEILKNNTQYISNIVATFDFVSLGNIYILIIIQGVAFLITIIKNKKFDFIGYIFWGITFSAVFVAINSTNGEYPRTSIQTLPILYITFAMFMKYLSGSRKKEISNEV